MADRARALEAFLEQVESWRDLKTIDQGQIMARETFAVAGADDIQLTWRFFNVNDLAGFMELGCLRSCALMVFETSANGDARRPCGSIPWMGCEPEEYLRSSAPGWGGVSVLSVVEKGNILVASRGPLREAWPVERGTTGTNLPISLWFLIAFPGRDEGAFDRIYRIGWPRKSFSKSGAAVCSFASCGNMKWRAELISLPRARRPMWDRQDPRNCRFNA